MTLKEAKKILKKEGFLLSLAPKVINQTGAIREFEKPEVCEAIKVANANRWTVGLSPIEWDKREARLKKEYGKNHVKGDFSGNKSIEHFDEPMPGPGEDQPKEKKGIIYPTTSPKADFYYKHVLNEGNPALAEAASQFNDALLYAQWKKIQHLGKEIARLKKTIHKKNMKIEELRKESSRHLRGKIKVFYENRDLEGKLKDKDAVLSDVAEELRLSKIREKNLTEVCQKYIKENEELKKELADKVVDKIDAQALKSAESALAYKEKVIAEKDEVIADLGKELAATKKKLEEKTKLVETVRNASKQYCEYGIAAEKMIQKMANVIVYGKPVSSEDFTEYRRWANGYRYNPQLSDFIEEEEKKLTAKTLDFNVKCMRAARESINDVFESYAAKYAKSSLDELKEKAYESFNAKAHSLGLVGSKDGNGLLNQMAGADVAEEGADQSGIIVLCGKDFAKILKENEEAAEELFKVLDDVVEFMSAEAEQLFEGDGIPTKMEVMEPSRKFKKIK